MWIVKMFLKYFYKNKNIREIRTVFVGKRLKIKQYRWLHMTHHPWEDKDPETKE